MPVALQKWGQCRNHLAIHEIGEIRAEEHGEGDSGQTVRSLSDASSNRIIEA
jgi:hypothetical protein